VKGLTLLGWIACWPSAIIVMWVASALCAMIYFAITAALNLGNHNVIQERMWFVYLGSDWCGGFLGMRTGTKVSPERTTRIISAMKIVLTSAVGLLAVGDVLTNDWMRLFQEVGFLGAIWIYSGSEEGTV
jgi:hypothetical protein